MEIFLHNCEQHKAPHSTGEGGKPCVIRIMLPFLPIKRNFSLPTNVVKPQTNICLFKKKFSNVHLFFTLIILNKRDTYQIVAEPHQ